MIDHITKFVELKLEIYELKVKSQMVNIISGFAILGLIISFGMFFIFFLSLTIGAYLNNVFESNYLGFAFIGLFYLVICLLLIFLKGRILKNKLFQAFFSDTLDHENDQESDVGKD